MQTNDNMNQEDRLLMSQIEKDISEIKIALLGSPMSGDRGLVGRISIIEDRIEDLEKRNIQNAVAMKIIIWVSSVVGIGFVGMVFKYFEK